MTLATCTAIDCCSETSVCDLTLTTPICAAPTAPVQATPAQPITPVDPGIIAAPPTTCLADGVMFTRFFERDTILTFDTQRLAPLPIVVSERARAI